MIRENNKKEFKGPDEDMPKYGAGSEYGREEREEARRKKVAYRTLDADEAEEKFAERGKILNIW